MLGFKISQLAIEDLDEIWIYSFKTWSENQADLYYETIFEEINRIREFPYIRKSINHVKEDHRIVLIKSHLIVYKIIQETVYVARVLHKSMDVKTKLND